MTKTVNTPVIRTVTKIAATEDDFITGNNNSNMAITTPVELMTFSVE